MKIGQLVSFGIGGADRVALTMCQELSKIPGIELLVFYTPSSIPSEPSWDQIRGVQQKSRYEQYLKFTKPILIQYAEQFNAFNLDILHTHRSGEDLWLIPGFEAVAKNYKVVETNFHGKTRTYADIRLFPSRELMRFAGIVSDSQNRCVPNPIPIPSSSGNLRSELGIKESFVIGRIGRADKSIFPKKLFEIYRKMQDNNTALLYVGPNPKAREIVNHKQLKNVYFYETLISEVGVSQLYNTFDVLLHVNKLGETFGNTVAEAMIHGKCVVSLAGNRNYPQAQREILCDQNQFFLKKKQAIEGLRRIKNDEKFRTITSILNRERAFREYESSKVVREVVDIYYEILN